MSARSARPARPGRGVRRTSARLRWCFRGNHEEWLRHSVFTQLRGVSIPQRAPLFNCSTTACAGRLGRTVGRPRNAFVRRAPRGGKLGCPVSAASPASAPAAGGTPTAGGAPAAGRVTPARRVTAPAGVVAAVVAARVMAAGRRTAAPVTGPPAGARAGRRAVRPVPPPSLAERQPCVPLPAHPARQGQHNHAHRQHGEFDRGVTHGVALLPSPEAAPVDASSFPPVVR